MKKRPNHTTRTLFPLLLAMLLLITGFGSGIAPAAHAEEAEPNAADGIRPEAVFRVSTVDELLDAIGPDRVIQLEDGEYNLTQARTYGDVSAGEYWHWVDSWDGYQLVIRNVAGLWLEGSDVQNCSIVTEPRYANVLAADSCDDLHISNLTAGHTPGEGYCSGGVLDFYSCSRVRVENCDLYGCGTYGITASESLSIIAENTVIHDCTYGAIETFNCEDVRFVDGTIRHCGYSKEHGSDWYAFNLLHAHGCNGFAVLNTEISGNNTQTLVQSSYTQGFLISGCSVRDNIVGQYDWGGMFFVSGQPVTVSGTEFVGNQLTGPFFHADADTPTAAVPVVDENGMGMDQAALEGLTRVPCDAESYTFSFTVEYFPEEDQQATGEATVSHVTTADEFLAAIGSNSVIYVDAPLIDLSTAGNYGGAGGVNYYWMEVYDGPCLVIQGVRNLKIIGQGKDITTLQATPRYADVLRFDSCSGIGISDLTAGHLREAPGSCAGDVFEFTGCRDVEIANCGLFGCGVNGIGASDSSDFIIRDTEIYECSEYGANLWNCSHFLFQNCRIHDCYANGLMLTGTDHILWNTQQVYDGVFEPAEEQASVTKYGLERPL